MKRNRDNTKNMPASKRKKKESTKKKTKKRDEVAEKEKGNVNIEDERQNIGDPEETATAESTENDNVADDE